jgi:superfamily II DNA/RNA helicase
MNLVINFDVPYSKNDEGFPVPEKETYLHRIRITGRFYTKGLSITLINENDQENEIGILNEIKDYYKSEMIEIKDVSEIKTLYNDHVVVQLAD